MFYKSVDHRNDRGE